MQRRGVQRWPGCGSTAIREDGLDHGAAFEKVGTPEPCHVGKIAKTLLGFSPDDNAPPSPRLSV